MKTLLQVNIPFRPSLGICPECGNVQTFDSAHGCTCRKCNYHVGSELAQQWIDYNEHEVPAVPSGEIVFAHEGEPNDFYFDVEVSITDRDERNAFVNWLKAIDGQIDENYQDEAEALGLVEYVA